MEEDTTTTTTVDETTTTTTEATAPEVTTETTTETTTEAAPEATTEETTVTEDTTVAEENTTTDTVTTETTLEPLAAETVTEPENSEQITTDVAGTANAISEEEAKAAEETQPEPIFDEQAHAAAVDTEVKDPSADPILGEDRPSDPLENTNDAIAAAQNDAISNAARSDG